jgi:hypothetical protein
LELKKKKKTRKKKKRNEEMQMEGWQRGPLAMARTKTERAGGVGLFFDVARAT